MECNPTTENMLSPCGRHLPVAPGMRFTVVVLPDRNAYVFLLQIRSSLVESILVAAQQTKRGSFRVIIVDSRPGVEGRQLADTLSAEGIPCTYVLLTAISYIMRVRTPSSFTSVV